MNPQFQVLQNWIISDNVTLLHTGAMELYLTE